MKNIFSQLIILSITVLKTCGQRCEHVLYENKVLEKEAFEIGKQREDDIKHLGRLVDVDLENCRRLCCQRDDCAIFTFHKDASKCNLYRTIAFDKYDSLLKDVKNIDTYIMKRTYELNQPENSLNVETIPNSIEQQSPRILYKSYRIKREADPNVNVSDTNMKTEQNTEPQLSNVANNDDNDIDITTTSTTKKATVATTPTTSKQNITTPTTTTTTTTTTTSPKTIIMTTDGVATTATQQPQQTTKETTQPNNNVTITTTEKPTHIDDTNNISNDSGAVEQASSNAGINSTDNKSQPTENIATNNQTTAPSNGQPSSASSSNTSSATASNEEQTMTSLSVSKSMTTSSITHQTSSSPSGASTYGINQENNVTQKVPSVSTASQPVSQQINVMQQTGQSAAPTNQQTTQGIHFSNQNVPSAAPTNPPLSQKPNITQSTIQQVASAAPTHQSLTQSPTQKVSSSITSRPSANQNNVTQPTSRPPATPNNMTQPTKSTSSATHQQPPHVSQSTGNTTDKTTTTTSEGNKDKFQNETDVQGLLDGYGKQNAHTSQALSAALISALSFGILFFVAVLVLIAKRCFDSWQKRHYSRIDYLINGMYN